jgi:hypothetical protein
MERTFWEIFQGALMGVLDETGSSHKNYELSWLF